MLTLLYYNLLICSSLLCIGCVAVGHIKISWPWFVVWLFITESTLHVVLVMKTRICYGCHIYSNQNCSRFFSDVDQTEIKKESCNNTFPNALYMMQSLSQCYQKDMIYRYLSLLSFFRLSFSVLCIFMLNFELIFAPFSSSLVKVWKKYETSSIAVI